MQVYASNGIGTAAKTPAGRRTTGGTFTLPAENSPTAMPAGPTRSLTGIDALLALQGVEDATERRKRAVKKGRRALDVLDDLKLGLLADDPDPAVLRRLEASLAELETETGDPRLDRVLSEIALRAGVELAKAGLG